MTLPPWQGRALIAGFGSIGRRHFQNLQALGCSKFVFYRTGRGTAPSEETAAWPVVNDLEAAWPYRPQIAVISNPSAQHLPVALAAARAGCDLFIEKPLAAALDGCDELAEEVRQRNLVSMIGCQFRFHPLLKRLREGLAAGAMGTVIGARAEWGEYLPDWHPWEDYRQSYSARAELGGGVVLTLIHPLDYLYWLFGSADRVHASTGRVAKLQTPAGEDWAEITLEFRSGVVGQVHLDYFQRPPVHRLTVWGERGRVEWDYHAGTLRWEIISESDALATGDQIAAGAIGDLTRTTIETVAAGFDRNTMFVDEMRHFLDCVVNRSAAAPALADGIAVLKLALAAKQSASERGRSD